VGRLGVLFYNITPSCNLFDQGLCMEIVSRYHWFLEGCFLIVFSSFSVATAGRTSQHHIISPKNYKSTTSLIIDLGRNSTIFLPLLAALNKMSDDRLCRFQKAIKKVRAVQRIRRNRGFAFSQTESADQRDQTRIIRAYDTSKSHARPSGY
jgi:hypothetical protein